jgi:hypothetical protein
MQARKNYVHFEDRVDLKETPNKDIPLNQMFAGSIGSIGSYEDRLFIKLEADAGRSWIYCVDAPLGATGEYRTDQPDVTNYRPVISLTAKI